MPVPNLPYDPADPADTNDLPERTGRIHLTARQRGADLTALGSLILRVPNMLMSLAVVFLLSYALDALFGPPWWIPLGCWVLSGALAFHRPCERVLARWLFDLRYPTPEESQRLRSVWREVTARAGVAGNGYQLWVEDSGEINAIAAAGHIVGVTSRSLRELPPTQLAGVLAHELGHHTRGHAWASLLTFWYALPGRLAWQILLRLTRRIDRLSVGTAAVVIGLVGAGVVAAATATYGLIFLPLITPYLAAAVDRRSELNADVQAAALGFAPELMAVLRTEHDRQSSGRATSAALGSPSERHGMATRLLATHPEVHTRLHRLQSYLERTR